MRDGASESTATPSPGSSRERQPAVTGDQAVPEPEPACGADLDRDEVAALRAILEGTARSTGAVFFQTLVRHLASALGVSFAFVAEFAGAPTRVRTLAYWGRGRIQENLEFELAGTPCEDVVRGGLCHHPQEVRERFPGDRLLVNLGIESYLGVPLLDGEGRVLGHLAVFDERPMAAELRRLFIFRIFAARAAVELERLRVEQQLRERERQLDSLMGHLPGMAYRALADEHWTALFASKGIEDLTGYPADEFTSRRLNYADIMLPEDRPATREAVFTALRERRMYEAEHRIRHKDGSVRWIWARGHGVFAPEGSLRFIEGFNQDITRQRRTEEALRESEQRWRSLTEALPQLVWSATPDGACDYFSTQWTQHTGVPESDLLGWRWLAVLHPDDREPTRRLWTESVAGRGPYDVEYRVRRSDGVYRWFKTRGTPIRDSTGRVVTWFGTCTDISDLRQTEEALRESEERFRGTFENAAVGIAHRDATGRFLRVNEKFCAIVGYSREELLQRTMRDITHPDDLAASIDAFTALWQGESPTFGLEKRYVRKDGSLVWGELFASLQRDAAGKPAYDIGIINDISERKQLEEELRASEESRRLIVDNAHDAFVAMSADGLIAGWNRQAEITFGWPRAEAVGRVLSETIIPPQFREAHSRGLARFLATGEGPLLNRVIEVPALRRDGGEFAAEISIAPVRLGEQPLFAAFIRDVTERKRAEEELHRAKEAAEAANRAKDEFLANVSHEIRTPMNAILGMTELVLDTPLAEDQRQGLKTVKSAADNLLDMINDLLDFSKIEAGKLELVPADFSLREAVGDTLRALAVRAHKKGLELIYQVQPDVPDALVGDAGRVRQVLLNLVGNAVKFTDEGETVVRVEINQGDGPPPPPGAGEVGLRFTVRDTGIGIPPDQQARIFRAFEQEDTSTTRRYGGTGLGLTIASRLVALMGGTITVDRRRAGAAPSPSQRASANSRIPPNRSRPSRRSRSTTCPC